VSAKTETILFLQRLAMGSALALPLELPLA
jgi:hypothetical protein